MNIKPFALERYFARHEFSARYMLSSSDPDGLSLAHVLSLADDECRLLWENLALGYTESRGLPLLRQEVARLYPGIAPEQVLEVVPEEGIFLAMNALLEPGDEVICMTPGYQSLYAIAGAVGCRVVRWEPAEREGWRFDPQFLRDHVTAHTKLVVVNFPHNPTGYLPNPEEFAEIVAIVQGCGAYLFSDEMYRFLEFDPADRLPSAATIYERAVSLFGMSKTFGLAGLRTGWVVTLDDALLECMATLKDYTTICPPAPSEILALIGLRAKERILADNLAKLARNLASLDSFFVRQAAHFSWVRPEAGTIGFARYFGAEGAEAFCERIVADAGVMLLPSTVYGYGDSHVRIGFGRENMPEALAVLENYLQESVP